ncbi:MAG: (2Fe-2S)-binding protein [Clostridia bacterium]
MARVSKHPILEIKQKKEFYITYNAQQLKALEGETIAATLLANGIRIFRYTSKYQEPRGLFCGIGQCTDCIMEVNGKPNIRTCITIVEPDMKVCTQVGSGKWGEKNA